MNIHYHLEGSSGQLDSCRSSSSAHMQNHKNADQQPKILHKNMTNPLTLCIMVDFCGLISCHQS